jgi:RNA recognition motif-containing protein
MKGIEKIDLENYFKKLGPIINIDFKPEKSNAIIEFGTCLEA